MSGRIPQDPSSIPILQWRTEGEVEGATRDGVAIVTQTFGLHSNEVGATQTAAELAWDMVTRDDAEMEEILENTLSIRSGCREVPPAS